MHQGKVRNVYLYNDQILLVASDRISAFDVILPNPIPEKGIVLTQMSRYWFDNLPKHIAHHVISYELPGSLHQPSWENRTTLCHQTTPLSIECIVRGYLAGSAWKAFQRHPRVQGYYLPDHLSESSQLPEPIFTPSTKAQEGHDLPLDESHAAEMVGEEIYQQVKQTSLEIYHWAHAHAKSQGILLADTKFEFGTTDDGKLLLIDEILTPDSSRFWPLDGYQTGKSQPSFDKQFVRDYLLSLSNWNQQPPGPELPLEIIQKTQEKYLEAYKRITNQKPHW